jgi:ABC-2 type transport system ATP-binding protein
VAEENTPVLSGRDIQKTFRRESGELVHALDGISLEVESGTLTALVGPDGAGKTTIIRLAAGLMTFDRGELKILGVDVAADPQQVQDRIGYMPQKFGLYEDLSVQENLDLYADLHGVTAEGRRQRYPRLMEMTALGPFGERLAGRLSGGMKQKLGLACTLVRAPELLLLDEPTSAMDPESAQLVRNEISRLRSSKRTIVICTHNLAEAESLADQIAIIYRGKILLNGTLDELKRAVLGPVEYEAKFAREFDAGELQLPSGATLASRSATSLRFRVEAPLDVNPKLVMALTSRNAPLVSFQEVPKKLEHVYLKTMADAQGVIYAA